jgi:hypothetical protein|nr:MAG TPA: Protein of unknown function (DUF3102) [Caudoviricetes sp.]
MNEIANTQQAGLTPIAVLAEEARIYSESMAMNMLNLGRVFTEAKKQVAHGEWGDWVQRYSGMSVRSAQQLMAIYSRFGDKPAFAGVEKSKMYKMLALPEGTEEAFAEKNDLSAMTSREVEEAVKRVREQANEEIRRERAARKAAEERAEELSARPPEVPEEVSAALKSKDAMIEQQKQELERIAATGRDSVAEANRLRSDNNRLRRELNENAELLEETQQECNRAQAELLNLQSTVAKGDAERTPCDELTTDTFAAAVRQFIGACARMPHMGRTFGMMRPEEYHVYDELLRTVEGWAKDARKALDTIGYEEVEIS